MGYVAMLRKISISSIATVLLVALLLISIVYGWMLDLYPEYDIFFMIFGQFLGSILFILIVIIIISVIVLILRRMKWFLVLLRKN